MDKIIGSCIRTELVCQLKGCLDRARLRVIKALVNFFFFFFPDCVENMCAVPVLLSAWECLCNADLETAGATLHKIFHH